MAEDEAPESVEVPSADLGKVIGLCGQTIKKLIRSTGCQIEVPRKGDQGVNGKVVVSLSGSPSQRRKAAAAILDVAQGGEPDDLVGQADGALVMQHHLDSHDRESWLRWRLVPIEHEFKVKVEMSRKAVRVWSEKRGAGLAGAAAEQVRAAVEAALVEAKELIEMTVDCRVDLDPEHASWDTAIAQLVDKHGVLIWVPQPEEGVIPVKVTGPAEAVKDAAALIQARFVKGKSTSSVMQVPDQIQTLTGEAAGDIQKDLKAFEEEYRAKLQYSRNLVWMSGSNSESLVAAKETLREMLHFYFPGVFVLRKGIKAGVIKKLREDKEMRVLMALPDCVVAFDSTEGSAWIAGGRQAEVQRRIDAVTAKWESENWEMDLEDYGVAMWLLGPQGTGDFLARMQSDSGARMIVDPVRLKVSAEGKPYQVKEAQRLVGEALKKLEEKKKKDDGRPPVVKPMLSDHPPHMKAILEQLAELKAKEVHELKQQRLREHQEAFARFREGPPEGQQQTRERSRSRGNA